MPSNVPRRLPIPPTCPAPNPPMLMVTSRNNFAMSGPQQEMYSAKRKLPSPQNYQSGRRLPQPLSPYMNPNPSANGCNPYNTQRNQRLKGRYNSNGRPRPHPIPQYTTAVQFIPSQVPRKAPAPFNPFADDTPGAVMARPEPSPLMPSTIVNMPSYQQQQRHPRPIRVAPAVAQSRVQDITMDSSSPSSMTFAQAPVVSPPAPRRAVRSSPSPPPLPPPRTFLSAADSRARLIASMILFKSCAGRKGKSPMKLGYVPSGLSQVVCVA